MEKIVFYINEFLYPIAEISASVLEFVGIIIIVVGSFRAIIRLIERIIKKKKFRIVSDIGKVLSLALEFKMGAEIIKTVIIRNLEELAILGIVIIIRAILAFMIHWEVSLEEKSLKNEK